MSEVESLKQENENLKNQLAQNSQGAHNLMIQLDAHKGELADARTISLQLRTNLVAAQKVNQSAIEQMNAANAQLEEAKKKIAELEKLVPAPKK